jgi:pimeloyl-ACP methyl ester carboxylesterase
VRLLATLALAMAGIALAASAALVVFQRRLLYHPERLTEAAALARAGRVGLVPWLDAGGALVGWRARHPPDAAPRAVALVLHGNAGSALDRAVYVEALGRRGVEVAILEYPGYGPRPGSPSHASLTRTAVEAVDLLAAERPGRPIWLVGESLGSGVAGTAAAQRTEAVRGLILVTPYADLGAVARLHFPFLPASAVRDRFRPARDLARFRGPALVVVAGRDEVVSPEQGRALHAALRGPKRLLEQPEAGHNTLDVAPGAGWWDEAVGFLEGG